LNKFSFYSEDIKFFNLFNRPLLHGPKMRINKLNELIKCTKNVFVLHESQCTEHGLNKIRKRSDKDTEFNEESYCIVVQGKEFASIQERYKGTCADNNLSEIGSVYNLLRQCAVQHDELSNDMRRDFKKIRTHVKKFIGKFHKIEKFYKRNKKRFEKSIGKYEEMGKSVDKIMDCRGLRGPARMAIGNSCFHPNSIYETTYSAFFVIFAGIILFFLTVLRLTEIVKFIADSDGDNQIEGMELGGV